MFKQERPQQVVSEMNIFEVRRFQDPVAIRCIFVPNDLILFTLVLSEQYQPCGTAFFSSAVITFVMCNLINLINLTLRTDTVCSEMFYAFITKTQSLISLLVNDIAKFVDGILSANASLGFF